MCLIVFAYRHHPQYQVILAGNRDEFYGREAQQAHFWDTEPVMLAGKDLRAGGTWLGISQRGEFGAITNYRDLKNPREGERSRGEIIPDYLTGNESPDQKMTRLKNQIHHYAGFNFLAGNADQIFYLNNISGDVQSVSRGIHGISNAFLDTPWPKVKAAKSAFEDAIIPAVIDHEAVFKLLQNSDPFPQEKLPDTGLSQEMEKAVSPIFIKTEDYGTRCSTLLTINYDGQIQFTEKTYHFNGDSSETVKDFSFNTAP